MHQMLALPSFLGFLLPLPAARFHAPDATEPKHRRAIRALNLSHHILRDVGLDDLENPADDPRWVQRPDLER